MFNSCQHVVIGQPPLHSATFHSSALVRKASAMTSPQIICCCSLSSDCLHVLHFHVSLPSVIKRSSKEQLSLCQQEPCQTISLSRHSCLESAIGFTLNVNKLIWKKRDQLHLHPNCGYSWPWTACSPSLCVEISHGPNINVSLLCHNINIYMQGYCTVLNSLPILTIIIDDTH